MTVPKLSHAWQLPRSLQFCSIIVRVVMDLHILLTPYTTFVNTSSTHTLPPAGWRPGFKYPTRPGKIHGSGPQTDRHRERQRQRPRTSEAAADGAREMAQLEHKDLSSNPITKGKRQKQGECIEIPALKERRAGPISKTQGRRLLGDKQVLFWPVSSCTRTHAHAHVHAHTRTAAAAVDSSLGTTPCGSAHT